MQSIPNFVWMGLIPAIGTAVLLILQRILNKDRENEIKTISLEGQKIKDQNAIKPLDQLVDELNHESPGDDSKSGGPS